MEANRRTQANLTRVKICTYLSVGGQFVEKPGVEPAMLEYYQTLSFLPTVLRADVVSAFEEKSGKK